jgi:FMN-dependent oxidoreductase (nitrilotriacetate monooxygenase family)
MAASKFHLGWFLEGSSAQAWGEPWTGDIGTGWRHPKLFIDIAQALERACFDYVLIEDSSYIGESYGANRDIYLRAGLSVPRQDPSVIATLLAASTTRIGIVPTFATFAYHPYLLARLVASLDQVSDGRIGWNMVTGSSDFAARNFGLESLPEHDLRYDMADEYMAVTNGLWDSWDPDALVADAESGVLADPAKVRAVDFEGKFYRSRGPLNSGPCVQGRPVIAQAGGSPRGRRFAATHADTVVASIEGPDRMKAYRDDVRSVMRAVGRDPDSCKILFLVNPILGETDEEAQARKVRQTAHDEARLDRRLALFSKYTNIDFAALDWDAPIGELTTNGHQQSLDELKRKAGDKTLREAMNKNPTKRSIELVGSPDTVAAQMDEAMQAVGGDGFLFAMPNVNRRNIAEVADGLVPALQRRGLVRHRYTHAMFRDNLLEF